MRSTDLCSPSGWIRSVRYWPGRAAGSGAPSGVLEADGDHGVALALDPGDGQPAEAGPGRRRAGRCQAGVAAAGLSLDQSAERRLPAGAEGGNPKRSEQLLARVPGQVEQRVDLRDRHLLRAGGELDDLVSCLHVAFLEHAEVEAGAAVGDEQGRDARVVHPDPDAVTGDAGLRDFEDGGADPVAVADADLVVAQSLDGEVLAELAVDEVGSSELAFPVAVGVDLVDEDGALLAAVPARSPWPSPSTLSLRTRRGPVTGSLNTPVKTVFPCHGTSFGMPTLTDSKVPTRSARGLAELMPARPWRRLRKSSSNLPRWLHPEVVPHRVSP